MLQPVSDEQPSGVDLEYDPAFFAMNAAAEAKPERQMGDSVIEAQEPDWKAVKSTALELLERSKDLRIVVQLTRAVLHTDGLGAFAASLELLRGLVTELWPSVHPELDASDNDDPTMRCNALAALGDANGVVRSLRETALVHARGLGSFSLRDAEVAEAGTGGEGGPTPEQIRGAFLGGDEEEIQAMAQSIEAARKSLEEIESALAGHLGPMAPNLEALASALAQQSRMVGDGLVARGSGGGGFDGPAPAGDLGGEESAAAPAAGAAPAAPAAPTAVESREDVVRAIDRICDYYRRREPSSPVPVLLMRARKLVDMGFLDVVKDLVPDGLSQAEMFRGPDEEDD